MLATVLAIMLQATTVQPAAAPATGSGTSSPQPREPGPAPTAQPTPPPGLSSTDAACAAAPRDAASGLATGKRQHQPQLYCAKAGKTGSAK